MPRVGYTPRPTDTYSFLLHPMRGADHLPTQQVRWWWFLGMAFLLKTFLGDGTVLEEKKTFAHLADAASPQSSVVDG